MQKKMKKIAIRMPNWVGDVVMATPFLRGVRQTFPDAHISLLIRSHLISILEGSPFFDEQIPIQDKGILAPFRLGLWLRKKNFQGVFILPHSFRSALVFQISGIPKRIGYSFGLRKFFLTHCATVKKEEWEGKLRPIPMDLYYIRLLETLGENISDRKLELPLNGDSKKYAKKYFQELSLSLNDKIVVFNPGASFGSTKLWSLDYFATLGDRLVKKHGLKILILCGPKEEKLAREIQEKMTQTSYSTHKKIIPLQHLGAILKQCHLMISTDSGPRHFATAFDIPLLVLMGPIHIGYTKLDSKYLKFVQEPTNCSPCHLKTCPIDHSCMIKLTPEKVQKEAEKLLDQFVWSSKNKKKDPTQ